MIPEVALAGEALVADGAPEAIVVRVGLLVLQHVSPAAESLLAKQTLEGFDAWRTEFMKMRAKIQSVKIHR